MLSQDDLNAIANAQAQYPLLSQNGISLLGIANLESASQANPDTAVSSTGAQGLFQILPSTATSPGYGVTPLATSNLDNPSDNADFAASYLTGLLNSGDTAAQAIKQYSGGGYNLSQVQSAASGNPVIGRGGAMAQQYGQDISGNANTSGLGTGIAGGISSIATGSYAWIVELFERAGIVVIGLALLILGLVFTFLDAKTVKTTYRNLGARYAA